MTEPTDDILLNMIQRDEPPDCKCGHVKAFHRPERDDETGWTYWPCYAPLPDNPEFACACENYAPEI